MAQSSGRHTTPSTRTMLLVAHSIVARGLVFPAAQDDPPVEASSVQERSNESRSSQASRIPGRRLVRLQRRSRARSGRDHRLDHGRRRRRAEQRRAGRERRRVARALRHPLRGHDPCGRPVLDSGHAGRRSLQRHGQPRRLPAANDEGRDHQPRCRDRPSAQADPGGHHRRGHRHGPDLGSVQLDAHRRRHHDRARRDRDPAQHQRPHQRLRASEPAVLGRPVRRRRSSGRTTVSTTSRSTGRTSTTPSAWAASPATAPASRRSRRPRSRRSRSTWRPTTCARATSSAPASTW